LIRNVSVDFQETPWIFGSVCVVLVGCLVLLPMSYLVEMRVAAYYVFLAGGLLFSTFLIMGLMLVPKLFRLKEESTSTFFSGVKSGGGTSLRDTTNAGEDAPGMDASRRASNSIKYQVRPTPPTPHDKRSGDNTNTSD
jgi:gamma-aminobutyric acid type B receptor